MASAGAAAVEWLYIARKTVSGYPRDAAGLPAVIPG